MKNFIKPLAILGLAILILLGMNFLGSRNSPPTAPRDTVPGLAAGRPETYRPGSKPQDEGELMPTNARVKNARSLPSFPLVAPSSEIASLFGTQLQEAEHESAQNQPLQRGLQQEREEEARPDQPDEAIRWRMQQLVDENGIVPDNALINAWEQTKQIPVDSSVWPTKNQSQDNSDVKSDDRDPEVGGIQPSGWTWLGPGNIGGRIRSILIHPTNSQIMWVGSVTGGIWKTTNGGTSWAALDDFMGNLAVTSMVMSPTDANVIYAGTGEGVFSVAHHPAKDLIRGAGVFKTTNGGTTWTQLSSTSSSDWYFVSRLAIHPTNGQIILAATSSGIWRSTDGGTSWSNRLSTPMLDVNFDPTDGNKSVASGTFGAGARYSTDGGSTWNSATGLPTLGRSEVAYARSSPSIVYASVDNNEGEIYVSSDGGRNFSLRNSGTGYFNAGGGGQGWYDNAIWVDPTDSNILIVGGIDLWRSINGGASFTKISDWAAAPPYGTSIHADHHVIVESSQYGVVVNGQLVNRTVFFGNDGGIYRTTDVRNVSQTSGWTELNNNLGITQFYSGAGNPTSGRIIGGTQDNGTLRYIGATETWDTPFGGDGGWSAADPNDSNYLYGEYVFLNIHRSTTGGASQSQYISGQYWNGFQYAWKPIPYRIPDAMSSQALFIAPFVLDPNNSSRILAGGYDLWRTNDAKAANTDTTGPSWASIKSSLGQPISAIGVAKGNSNIIWVGYNNGDVYFTTNGTVANPTWTRVDSNSPGLPNRYCTRITIDPTNSNRVYATFGGFSSGNVWRTENGGTTWTNISNNLPSAPVRTLAVWQQNPSYLYVGTEVGIFASANGGQNWSPSNDGPTNCPVDELFWMNNTLVAATHGRGMFSIPITGSGGCTYSLSQFNQSFGSAGGNGSFSVTSSAGCAWSAVSNASWITTTSNGSGNGTVNFVVASNTDTARNGTISVGGQTFTVNQSAGGGGCASTALGFGQTINGTLATSDCFFTGTTRYVDVYNFSGTAGQQIAISMNASFDTFIYLLDSSTQLIAEDDDGGVGTNSRIPADTGFFTLPGSGTYTIYATSFSSSSTGAYSINLSAGSNCNYALNPTSQIFIASASTGSFTVSTAANCSWSATSNASWLTTSSSGTGNGTVNYFVAGNTGNARNGTIGVGGQTFTVFQSAGNGNGCPVAPIAVGQTFNDTLSTGCVFTGTSRYVDLYDFTGTAGQQIVIAMSSSSFDTFLFLNDPSNHTIAQDDDGGGGTNSRIPASASSFTLPASGIYRIFATSYSSDGTSGSTGPYTISLLSATSCSYSINPTSQSASAAGGSSSFSISAPAGCTWTALSNANWIATSSSGSGNGTINYSVAANTGTARTGTISVGGQVFTVNQADGTPNYAISVSAFPVAGGTVSGSGTFPSGSSRTVTATANAGYTFSNWTEGGGVVSSLASYTFTLSGNRNLIANFTVPVTYTITVNASPGAGGTVGGGGTFAAGSSRTVTATANAGYTFSNWTENGVVVSFSASYNFTLNGNRNLVANFEIIPTQNYTITVSAAPSAGGTVGGGGTFAAGSSRTVTAAANAGYTFSNWTENGGVVSSSSSYTFTLNGPRNLVANFSTGIWANLVGVSASGNSLTKTAPDGWDNAGAVSTASLPSGDGYLEFTATEIDKHRMCGLSNGNTNQHYADIDFAIYLASGGVAWVYESGASKNVYVPYQPGDRFRVAVANGVVKYLKNGTAFYTSNVAPTYPLLIDTSLHTTGATIADATLLSGSPNEPVVWTKLVGVNASGNSLTKTAGDSWTNAGASSTRAIGSGDGYVEFIATENNKHRMCGLSNADTNQGYQEIKYEIYLNANGSADAWEAGVGKAGSTLYQAGDRFRVAVQSGVVKYSKNGIVFYTSPVAPTYPLLVDTSLFSQGATITSAVLDGNLVPVGGAGNQSPVANAGGPYNGAPGAIIQFNAGGSFDPDGTVTNYAWTFGDGTTGSGATPTHIYSTLGSYTVTLVVTDNGGATASVTTTVTVASGNPQVENVVWTKLFGVSVSGNSLTKVIADGFGNSGASSTRALGSGDGYLEFTATEIDKHRMCGLSNGDANQNLAEMRFAVYLATNGVAWVYESGASKNVYVPYQSGDRFRVAVEGGGVKYRKNGTLFYTSTVAPSYPLLADASLHTTGATITNAVLSGNLVNVSGGGGNQNPVANAGGPYSGAPGAVIQFNGGASNDPDGTITNYAWTFGDGTIGSGATPTHAYSASGSYTAALTVTDNLGATNSATATVNISPGTPQTENVVWTNVVGVSAAGNSLTKTAADSWTNAGASSAKGIVSGDGYVEFTATETNKHRMCGLSNVDTNQNYPEIKFAIYLATDGVAWVYESGVSKNVYVNYQTGNTFRVSVASGVVRYSRNGVVFYTSTVVPTYPLLVDTSLHTTGATITNAVISGTLQSLVPTLENVIWTNVIGVFAAGNNLTKTAGDSWTNAGASSTRVIPSGDGYVEFTATEINKHRMCGLGNGDTNQNYPEIKFAIYLATANVAWVYESGISKNVYTAYQAGDIFRVSIEGGVVKYRKNGTVFYSSTVAPTYPMLVDTSLHTNGATITNAVIFGKF